MSLSPSVAVPRASFNTLPLYIGLFCLLWSFAFVAGKIGVTYCPPLILLTARFSLAGILILGAIALRGESWPLSFRDTCAFALIGVANNALYLGLGYTGLKTVSAGLGGLIVSASRIHGDRGRTPARRTAHWAQNGRTVSWRCRCRLHRLASHVGRHRQPTWDIIHASIVDVDRGRYHPLQAAGAQG